MEQKIAGLILSAGYSSRMGRLKALLPFGDETVIHRQIRCFNDAGISDIFVVTGFESIRINNELKDSSVITVHNAGYSEGMFSSVQTGLRAIDSELFSGVIMLPVDYPLINPFILQTLMKEFSKKTSPIIYPCYCGKKGHPPLFSTGLNAEIINHSGENGIKGVLYRYNDQARYIDMNNADCLVDMDTVEDYRKALERYRKHDFPDPDECAFFYGFYNVPEAVIRHCSQTAHAAEKIAAALNEKGYDTNPKLLYSCGLMHDIFKTESNHAGKAAELLGDLGYGGMTGIVGNHMDIGERFASRVCNESVFYLADKITDGEDFVSLDKRKRRMADKLGENTGYALKKLDTAAKIQEMVESALAVDLIELVRGTAE